MVLSMEWDKSQNVSDYPLFVELSIAADSGHYREIMDTFTEV